MVSVYHRAEAGVNEKSFEEGSAAAMAVTAAPTRKVNPVAWMSSRVKLLGRFGQA
jgi:hypothetical protein